MSNSEKESELTKLVIEETCKVFSDILIYGTGYSKDGKHIPLDEVVIEEAHNDNP